MELKERISIEKKIVTRAVDCIFENQGKIMLRVDGEELYDDFVDVSKRVDLFKKIFDLDEVIVFVKFNEEDPLAWFFLIFGERGWDVINDYSEGLETILKPAHDLADGFMKKYTT